MAQQSPAETSGRNQYLLENVPAPFKQNLLQQLAAEKANTPKKFQAGAMLSEDLQAELQNSVDPH